MSLLGSYLRRLLHVGTRRIRWGILALVAIFLGLGAVQASAVESSASATVLYERGASALRAGDGTVAADFLGRAAQLEPNRWQTLALYGRALLVKGDNAEAIDIFNRVQDLHPSSKDLNYYRGIASYRLGRWADTIRYLTQVTRERNQSGRVHLYLGIAYQELGSLAPAERELALASSLDPTLEGSSSYRLGIMALEQKNADEARKYLQRVLDSVPGSALARSATVYIEQIDSGEYRSVAFYAKMGGGYDSNVSLQTGEVEGLQELRSGVGSTEFGINGLIVDTEKIDVRIGGTGYINYHGMRAKTYDQVLTNAYTLASLKLADWARLGFIYRFEYVWADYEEFRLTNHVEGSLRFLPHPKIVVGVYYGYQHRDYLFDLDSNLSELNRDGGVQRAGIDILWELPDWTGWGSNFVTTSFLFRQENSKGTEYDSNGYAPELDVGIALPWEMFWTSRASYEWRDFDHASCLREYPPTTTCNVRPAAGSPKRRDRNLRISTDLRIPVVPSVFVDLIYSFTKRKSNVDFYQYERNLVQFVATYRY